MPSVTHKLGALRLIGYLTALPLIIIIELKTSGLWSSIVTLFTNYNTPQNLFRSDSSSLYVLDVIK